MSGNGSTDWKDVWEKVKDLSAGGQGSTSVVRRRDLEDESDYCVLKILNRQKDPERRRRMYREVAALKTLSHSGIPALIESNADQFDDFRRAD